MRGYEIAAVMAVIAAVIIAAQVLKGIKWPTHPRWDSELDKLTKKIRDEEDGA